MTEDTRLAELIVLAVSLALLVEHNSCSNMTAKIWLPEGH